MLRVRKRRNERGTVLLDGLIAAIFLTLGALAFYSLLPVTSKAQVLAQQHTVAVQIGNRMVEHLLLLKPSNLNPTALGNLGLIDAGQSTSPYTFTNLALDDGWDYSPAKVLPQGTGQLTITNVAGGSRRVRLVISWVGPGGAQSYTTGTILGGYR